MNEGAVSVLVTLLERVRERSRSTWPALVEAHPGDEAVGHGAFASLEDAAGAGRGYDGDVIESSPRIKLIDGLPPATPSVEATPEAALAEEGEAPVLELLGERLLGDVAEAELAEAMPLLDHVTLGELVMASLALRPRSDAW